MIRCLLPFAPSTAGPTTSTRIQSAYFANDQLTGTAGWSQNDMYQSAQGDVYTPRYNGNTNHTGWKVTDDYGRQMVLKDGEVGTFSAGWANTGRPSRQHRRRRLQPEYPGLQSEAGWHRQRQRRIRLLDGQ